MKNFWIKLSLINKIITSIIILYLIISTLVFSLLVSGLCTKLFLFYFGVCLIPFLPGIFFTKNILISVVINTLLIMVVCLFYKYILFKYGLKTSLSIIFLILILSFYLVFVKIDSSVINNCNQREDHDGCFYNLAWQEQDPQICDNIKSTDRRDECYGVNTASKYKDGKRCEILKNQKSIDSCYSYLASQKQDKKFCDKISLAGSSFSYDLYLSTSIPNKYELIPQNFSITRNYCYEQVK